MNVLWTAIVPSILIVGAAFTGGYLHGRAVGREQGATDVRRRLEQMRRASR